MHCPSLNNVRSIATSRSKSQTHIVLKHSMLTCHTSPCELVRLNPAKTLSSPATIL